MLTHTIGIITIRVGVPFTYLWKIIQAKHSARMTEIFPCMFPVNNRTQLDATLDHSLNKDCSYWEAEEQLASSRSVDRSAQRQADLTLAEGEAAG